MICMIFGYFWLELTTCEGGDDDNDDDEVDDDRYYGDDMKKDPPVQNGTLLKCAVI